ncbi:hypothetical protein B0T20DRAFT_8755 [Sordaria brevicollis]|uniref:Uncharacterized protein n=1 Tax=Sordaria brevicollis TaxID=83679 RepID=A0AAE0PN79_SORBR|nr:hypothetical protein B0T20DRAFT_8755 [Sordaria brevicollis]
MTASSVDSYDCYGRLSSEEAEELWPGWKNPFDEGFKYPIPDLRDDESFNDWSDQIQHILYALDLVGFIFGTESPPKWWDEDDPIHKHNLWVFQQRSYCAFRIISLGIQPISYDLEEGGFWVPLYNEHKQVTNKDPMVLWEAIKRWNTEVPYKLKCKYLKELSNIDLDQFADLKEYLERVLWLHHRLRAVKLEIPGDVQASFVIQGLRTRHTTWTISMNMRLKYGEGHDFDTVIRAIRGLIADEAIMNRERNVRGNCAQPTEHSDNRNHRRRQNNKRRGNAQGHHQRHTGVTKHYASRR